MRKKLLVLSLMVLLTCAFSLYAQSSSAHAAAITGHPSGAATHALHPNASIGQVPCTQPDFTWIYNTGGGATCYANPGFMGVNLPNITHLWAGNNYGWIKCYSTVLKYCNYGKQIPFGSRGGLIFIPAVLITQVCLGCRL